MDLSTPIFQAVPVNQPLHAGNGEVTIEHHKEPLLLHGKHGHTDTIANKPEPVALPVTAFNELVPHDGQGSECDI
jgi:hypothetical protein